MDWILLNKDTPFLEFSTQEDEFGDVMALERTWFSSLRPIGYKSLLSFLEGRRAPKHRKHIEQLLAQYGCRTLDGFLQVSHTLSLNDTFWVKQADSQLCWRDVSLFQNDFDEIIAEDALNGSFSEQSLSSSPHRNLPRTDTMPSAGSENRTVFTSIRLAAPPMSWSRFRNIWLLRFPASCAPMQFHMICDSITEDWYLLVPCSPVNPSALPKQLPLPVKSGLSPACWSIFVPSAARMPFAA